jgi:hypothetical protein
MVKAVRHSFSSPSQALIDDFKRACESRGHTQSYVLSSAMMWFISRPHAKGWRVHPRTLEKYRGGEIGKQKKS